ncbi:MAG: glycosyltransferase family 2 protein [Patescibacteria group bacterium]
MKNIELSIIIVSFNTCKLLESCLQSIYFNENIESEKQLVYEVIVTDNYSVDGSIEMVEKKYPQVRLIKNNSNVGFGKANNQGIKIAKGNTILFLNSDILVQKNAIIRLYKYFTQLPSKSIVGGRLFNLDGSPQPSCGPAYTLINIFVALFLKGDYLHLTRYSPQSEKEVDWVMGACIMAEKKAFKEIGGFDEGIFMYMEEIDWQFRAKQLDYRIFFYPNAQFTHVGAASSQGRATPILNVFKGFKYFYKKHFPGWKEYCLRVFLLLKSLMAIALFTIMNKKNDHKLYKDALKIAIS